ncbi:MAG: hypothetical protein AB7N80_05060 [Bdellovibrionales bacterium]
MHIKQTLLWTFTAIVLVGIGAGFWQMSRPKLAYIGHPMSIREIQTSGIDREGAPQDVIVFGDGTTLREIGYDVVHVGTIQPEKGRAIFLFKGFSCRACEPTISLWVYNSGDKTAERFVYPGQHFTVSGVDGKEVLEHSSQAIFGRCGEKDQLLLLAQKQRDVESDQWNFTTTLISFSATGEAVVQNTNDNSFEKVKTMLDNQGCLEIEPEDSHDYM